MKIVVKPRFNTQRQNIERYGPQKYMMNLPFQEDSSSSDAIIAILSKSLGMPSHRIHFVNIDSLKNWVFEVD